MQDIDQKDIRANEIDSELKNILDKYNVEDYYRPSKKIDFNDVLKDANEIHNLIPELKSLDKLGVLSLNRTQLGYFLSIANLAKSSSDPTHNVSQLINHINVIRSALYESSVIKIIQHDEPYKISDTRLVVYLLLIFAITIGIGFIIWLIGLPLAYSEAKYINKSKNPRRDAMFSWYYYLSSRMSRD